MKQTTMEDSIATFDKIRTIIDDIEENSELQNVLRLSYLFGLRVQEIVGKEPLYGKSFSEISIAGEEAILGNVPTAKRAWKPMTVAIPLNPKYEKWSPIILDLCESRFNVPIAKWRSMRNVQRLCRKVFMNFHFPMLASRLRSGYYSDAKLANVTHKTLREIRGAELSLCNRFSAFDVLIFLRHLTPSDYTTYFDKLLDKTNYYIESDIKESLKIKNIIFQPKENIAYNDFRTYMEIQKQIKMGELFIERDDASFPRPTCSGTYKEVH